MKHLECLRFYLNILHFTVIISKYISWLLMVSTLLLQIHFGLLMVSTLLLQIHFLVINGLNIIITNTFLGY